MGQGQAGPHSADLGEIWPSCPSSPMLSLQWGQRLAAGAVGFGLVCKSNAYDLLSPGLLHSIHGGTTRALRDLLSCLLANSQGSQGPEGKISCPRVVTALEIACSPSFPPGSSRFTNPKPFERCCLLEAAAPTGRRCNCRVLPGGGVRDFSLPSRLCVGAPVGRSGSPRNPLLPGSVPLLPAEPVAQNVF